MTPSWLDDVLSSIAGPSRSNHFITYVLETPLPGVHFNVDNEESLPAAPTSTQIVHRLAGLVDVARDDRLLPGYERNIEEGGSFNPATNILTQEVDQPLQEEGHVLVNHSEYLNYLSEKGPTFMK